MKRRPLVIPAPLSSTEAKKFLEDHPDTKGRVRSQRVDTDGTLVVMAGRDVVEGLGVFLKEGPGSSSVERIIDETLVTGE
jgi:hypothetical protein